jgi:hypothetical protein
MATQAAGSRQKEMNDTGNGIDNTATGKTGSALDQAKETGSNLLSDTKAALTDKASTAVDDKKAVLTSGLTSVADSMRKLSGSLGEAEQNPLTEYSARYAEAAAGKVEDVARYFETADIKTVARDVESFARRNPAVFVGSAFTLGLLAARFMKSSSGSTAAVGSQGQGGNNRSRSSKTTTSSTPSIPQSAA